MVVGLKKQLDTLQIERDSLNVQVRQMTAVKKRAVTPKIIFT